MQREKLIIILCKIFCIGLIVQFFAHTFITFKLGITSPAMDVLWVWKEIFVIAGALCATYIIRKKQLWKEKNAIWYMTILFVVLNMYMLADTLLKGLGIGWFLKAWKYDTIGFMIFLSTYYIAPYVSIEQWKKFVRRFFIVIKHLLVWAMVWYAVLLIKPGALKLFGYDRMSIEGEVGKRPPAVYRTREFEGFPRNQFVFERPISRGFFLVALFPLFFIQYLQRKSIKKTRFWWTMYGANIVFTYSRAAWGSWIIELAILGLLTYRKQIKIFLRKILLPLIVILCIITFALKDQIIHRQFSNTGHIQLLVQGRKYFSDNWLLGMGAGSVGPASHRIGGLNFNPENQFLQIAIEFGIIGFIMWMVIYLWLHWIGGKAVLEDWKQKQLSKYTWYIIAFSIGMLGLSISGLVLHSFTDRMIVYPFMLLGGVLFYLFMKDQQQPLDTDTRQSHKHNKNYKRK